MNIDINEILLVVFTKFSSSIFMFYLTHTFNWFEFFFYFVAAGLLVYNANSKIAAVFMWFMFIY